MKTLNKSQLDMVSGGKQYILLETRIDTIGFNEYGIPDTVVLDFYTINKSKLNGMTIDKITNDLLTYAQSFANSPWGYGVGSELISAKLVHI